MLVQLTEEQVLAMVQTLSPEQARELMLHKMWAELPDDVRKWVEAAVSALAREYDLYPKGAIGSLLAAERGPAMPGATAYTPVPINTVTPCPTEAVSPAETYVLLPTPHSWTARDSTAPAPVNASKLSEFFFRTPGARLGLEVDDGLISKLLIETGAFSELLGQISVPTRLTALLLLIGKNTEQHGNTSDGVARRVRELASAQELEWDGMSEEARNEFLGRLMLA